MFHSILEPFFIKWQGILMKNIMFLLLVSPYMVAMESPAELQPELQAALEKSEYRKQKLALLHRAVKTQELKLLIRNSDKIKFDLPDQWIRWEAFVKTDIKAIFDAHIQEFSQNQQAEMEKLVEHYKKQALDEKELMKTAASEK